MKVWILVVNHRHGLTVSAHRSFDGASACLYEYVSDWWDKEMANAFAGLLKPLPEDAEEAIATYFEHMADSEWYEIHDAEVED